MFYWQLWVTGKKTPAFAQRKRLWGQSTFTSCLNTELTAATGVSTSIFCRLRYPMSIIIPPWPGDSSTKGNDLLWPCITQSKFSPNSMTFTIRRQQVGILWLGILQDFAADPFHVSFCKSHPQRNVQSEPNQRNARSEPNQSDLSFFFFYAVVLFFRFFVFSNIVTNALAYSLW